MHYVYLYRDPRPNKKNAVVYVGKGSGDRAYEHWERPYRCKNKKLYNLLQKLRKEGLEPLIEIAFEFENEQDALDKEVELIALFGRADLKKGTLFNNTDGGEGFVNIGPEVLERRTRTIKAVHNTPEVKEKNRLSGLKSWSDPERKRVRVANMRDGFQNPEYRKKLSVAIKAAHARPEVKAKKGQSTKARWADPEGRKTFVDSMKRTAATPENKEKRGSRTKDGWENAETRRKRTEGIRAAQTPEMVAKRAKANKAGWTEEKRQAFAETMRRVCADPEQKKKRSEAAKKAWAKRKASLFLT